MKTKFRKGQKVYFHCYVGNKADNKSFLCHGVVTDFNREVYKVLVTGVNAFSIGEPVSNRLLKALLGKTVPRNENQLQSQLNEIANKLYGSGKWICWEEEKIKRIIKTNEEKRNVTRNTPSVPNDTRVARQTREAPRETGTRPSDNPVHGSADPGQQQKDPGCS